jgi:hypothetical protein
MAVGMRFFFTDGPPPALIEITEAMQRVDAAFAVVPDPAQPRLAGDLVRADARYARLERYLPADELFADVIEEYAEALHAHDHPDRLIALDVVQRATGVLFAEILRAGHEDYATLDRLWMWLFETRAGLLQIDEDGFYDSQRLLVGLL